MNRLVIPPSPNWYESDVAACAPDNTLLYAARNDLVVIKSSPAKEPDDVKIITRAHNTRVTGVNINKNWGQPNKYAVTVSEDKVVKLWDVETLEKKLSHNKHVGYDSAVRGASFAGDDRVISVSENGTIVIWNVVHNETNIITSLFENRPTVTFMSICPHASWLAAFGLRSGLVIVADLRKTGRILYKLRGHDKSVVSLSWCPVPVNIFPIKPQNRVGQAKQINENTEEISTKEIQNSVQEENIKKEENDKSVEQKENNVKERSPNKTDLELKIDDAVDTRLQETDKKDLDAVLENVLKSPSKRSTAADRLRKIKESPWSNLKFVDDDDVAGSKANEGNENEKESESDADNYLKECKELRDQILKMSTVEPTQTEVAYTSEGTPRLILKARSRPKAAVVEEEEKKTEEQKDSVEITVTDKSNSSVDSANSSNKQTTDQSSNESSCDLNVTGSSKKSSDLSDVSFHSADDVLDEKSNENLEEDVLAGGESTEAHRENDGIVTKDSESAEVDDIVLALKKKFKEDKVLKRSFASDESSVVSSREIPLEHCEVEEPRKEFLLASSAKEGSVYIWRAGTDGRLQTSFTIPNLKTYGKRSFNKYDNIWITLCWITPNVLLTSSRHGELLQWNLPKPKDPTKQFRLVHKDHWGILFNLIGPMSLLSDQNWLDDNRKLNVWSLGQDRMVINTDLGKETTNLCCYPTLGGAVTCFAGSPVDPNRLAMGTSDSEIRIWDLSREHTKRIIFSRYYNKIQSKLMWLAWHPTNEMCLAYGTLEGRVGIIDTSSQNKVPKLLPDFFQTQIYKLEWGPKPDCKDYCLYVCALGKVAIFDTKGDKDPTILDVPDNTVVYTFAWKPDYTTLLVSAKSGALITYSADLTIQQIYYLHEKLCSIVWHPDACSEDVSASKYSKVFASVVKNYQCAIYDLSVESEENDIAQIAKFDNGESIITSMAWSPHDGNHLVVGDEHGAAHVYDVESKAVLATYTDSDFEHITSVIWSPLDSDYIINGSLCKLVVWKVSDHPPIALEEIELKKKEVYKAQKKEMADQIPKEKAEAKETKEKKSPKPVKSDVLPIFYSPRAEAHCSDMRKLIDYKDGVEKSVATGADSKTVDILSVFGKNSDILGLVDTNINTLRKRGKQINSNMLTLWKGDISTDIKNAIEVKRVTPQLIVMCAIFAPKLLQNACEVYIEQLMDRPDSDPVEIVMYLLACHKVEGAIKVLCDNQLYKEALTLAKCRLPQDDPIILDILEKWAKSNVYSGSFELAAMCYITLGKFEDASSVLFRRTTKDLLELSSDLAKRSGNEELYKAVVFRLNAFSNHTEENEHQPEEASTENGLAESPRCNRLEKILEKERRLEEKSQEMNAEDFVNEVDHIKHHESQIFDRFVEEDLLYQMALANEGMLQQQKIQNILKRSPVKNRSSSKQNGDSSGSSTPTKSGFLENDTLNPEERPERTNQDYESLVMTGHTPTVHKLTEKRCVITPTP